jgi:CRP-like cAMP-binding protein
MLITLVIDHIRSPAGGVDQVTDVIGAFGLGVLSAASLGLGALTARLWRPTNFILGLLTAFGAGALLSAVTIDIVAPSVEIGDFGWLAGGAVVGGLVFEGLNRIINARGGFLRKASTSITFLRDRDLRRRRTILDGLERIDIFDGLPDRELDTLARAFRTARLDAGDILYRRGDPCDHLNVLAKGEVALATSSGVSLLHPYAGFGHMAFVSGTQHRSVATAKQDSEVLRLNRDRLRSVLEHCPVLADRFRERVRSDELLTYIRTNHPEIDENAIDAWSARFEVEEITRLPQLVDVAATTPAEHLIDHLTDVGPFRGTPHQVLHAVADLMFREEHEEGYVFFRPGEVSDRMYVLADGDVAVVDATGESEESIVLEAGEEFGLMSCFTGMRHTSTAIAQGVSEVWVLRRSDLEKLMRADPTLRRAVAEFVGSHRVAQYLERDHGLERARAAETQRRTINAVRRGAFPPIASARVAQGAPIAIWLGLLLDAIPESLVIGATAEAVRWSFIAGIFLSNYPEALASSVGMREQSIAWRNVAGLWGTVILVTGLGAALGSVVFQRAPEPVFAVVEGLAAGAMLTVITQTMMPEALHRSGGFVGLAALAGFLFTTLLGT